MSGNRVIAFALGILLSLSLSAAAPAQTITVASKNFTEQYIVAEIYAQALEAAGFKVSRKINLGITLIVHNAIVKGDVDVYPEYTGTALAWIVKGDLSGTPEAIYKEVKDYYEKNLGLTWLNSTGIDDSYTMVVRKDTADKYKLDTLTSLAAASKNLIVGGPAEFGDREDGLPGLKRVYGIEFKDFKKFAKMGLRYDALAEKDLDIVNGHTTDWQIAHYNLVALRDDKHLFPPYFLAPIVRMDTLQKYPKIGETLNRLAPLLTNEKMRLMTKAVENDREESADVARAFLKEAGIVK